MSSVKSCVLSSFLLFHVLFLSPVQAHKVASTIFWRDNKKIAGHWEGNTVWYPIPVDIQPSSSMFPTTCATTASLSEPARVGDRHTMSARSPYVGGIPWRAIGLPGIMFATLGVSSAGRLGPNPYHTSPKVTNISPDQISTPLLWNIWSVASYQFVLRPLTNSYNQDPAPSEAT